MVVSQLNALVAEFKGDTNPGRSNRPGHKGTGESAGRATGSKDYVPPESQVQELLSQYEDYTWQGHVASEMGWSDSKTSRVLSTMEEEDMVIRRQVGRRKAVFLPGEIPEYVK